MPNPDPIPVYIGDDWSFAFSYRQGGGNGVPVDLTGSTIVCELFYPFTAAPLALTQADGQTALIDAPEGRFAVGVARAVTTGFVTSGLKAPSQPSPSVLTIALEKDGIRRTIGVRPLLVLDPRTLPPPPIVTVESVDPITGCILRFEGLTDFFAVTTDATRGGTLALGLDLGQSPPT